MEFCKALDKALEAAPTQEAKDAVQAVIASHCTSDVAPTSGGGTPGGGNGNGPPGGGD